MIFATFLGSCLCIGLLAAALGTKSWIISKAVIAEFNKSDGDVSFGLFQGEKNLNHGFGWRSNPLYVSDMVHKELVYSLWLGAVICMCLSIITSTCAAVFAVINSATTPILTLVGIPGLYLWNSLSILFQLSVIGLWIGQYYTKLRYSVLSEEERNRGWTSENMAFFGYSFWLVAVSAVIQFVNIIFIYLGTSEDRQKKVIKPVIEEKTNGAIMLY